MITSASFVISSPDVMQCPQTTIPEYAFIGRSNVGKSSLINMLTHNPKLAKTSQKPGKTLLINHFLINAGIVLHGTTAQGIETRIHAKVVVGHIGFLLSYLIGFQFPRYSVYSPLRSTSVRSRGVRMTRSVTIPPLQAWSGWWQSEPAVTGLPK